MTGQKARTGGRTGLAHVTGDFCQLPYSGPDKHIGFKFQGQCNAPGACGPMLRLCQVMPGRHRGLGGPRQCGAIQARGTQRSGRRESGQGWQGWIGGRWIWREGVVVITGRSVAGSASLRDVLQVNI